MMTPRLILLVLMLGNIAILPDHQTATAANLPKLEIYRPEASPVPAQEIAEPRDPNQIYTRSFKIISYSCCPPPENKKRKTRSAKSVLEEAGIDFPKGTDAKYNPHFGVLTVSHNEAGMSLVEIYIASISGKAEKYILLQIEIYRMPAALVFQIQESAESQSDHGPERNAVLKLAKNDQVQFVTSVALDARSGQRAKLENAAEYRYLDHYEWDEGRKKSLPVFKTRSVGTIFEADPVLGANEFSLDINFHFEHHTATPTQKITQIRLPGSEDNITVSLPVFHTESITTSLSTISGTTQIIGTFRPTGKAEYQQDDLMDIVFLKSTVMFVEPKAHP